MNASLTRAAGLLLGLFILTGCGGTREEVRGLPTAPGFTLPSIRGVYSAPGFWSFEALRLADATTITWSCEGRVTVVRQSGTDFLGTFTANPPDGQLCTHASGDMTGGIVRADTRISFDTRVTEQDPDTFFAFPDCVVVTQEAVWSGTANGDHFIATRRLTVDCPADGRMEVTAKARGSRTTASNAGDP